MKRFLFIIWGLLILTGCPMETDEDEFDSAIIFNNNSDKAIFWTISNNYPDTFFQNLDEYYVLKRDSFIKPGETMRIDYFFLSRFESSKNGIVSFYCLDKNVLEANTEYEIRKKYLILKRYDFTITDLDFLKWSISYPPNEAMKNIKMYPPYKP